MATEKPYTLLQLVGTLAALTIEGSLMVMGTTWIAFHSSGGVLAAYLFAFLIALLAVGMGALQVHYYRQDNSLPESEG